MRRFRRVTAQNDAARAARDQVAAQPNDSARSCQVALVDQPIPEQRDE
jgi:hypothetical protein